VELRQAPFIFWIQDLSVKDPYFILPILMGLTMLIQQKLSPPPPDPAQAKMMMFLPIIFTIFFATFPAGLVLYWITNSAVGVLQQWYVMRTHKAKTAALPKKLKR
jgi:YidC/Oxa1 family membrane protein insertase